MEVVELGFWGKSQAPPQPGAWLGLSDYCWSQEGKEAWITLLVDFLRMAGCIREWENGYSFCRFGNCTVGPGHQKSMGCAAFQLKNLYWTEGLTHYLEHHECMPPPTSPVYDVALEWAAWIGWDSPVSAGWVQPHGNASRPDWSEDGTVKRMLYCMHPFRALIPWEHRKWLEMACGAPGEQDEWPRWRPCIDNHDDTPGPSSCAGNPSCGGSDCGWGRRFARMTEPLLVRHTRCMQAARGDAQPIHRTRQSLAHSTRISLETVRFRDDFLPLVVYLGRARARLCEMEQHMRLKLLGIAGGISG